MYVVVGYHGLDDQCVSVRVVNMVCISFTEGDVVHLPSELLCRPLVQRVLICERFFLCFSNIVILDPSRLSGQVWSVEDGPNFLKRFTPILVILVMDVVSEVTITDEFLNLLFEHDTLLCGVVEILVISIVLILISFGVVSSQQIRPLVDVCLFGG